MTKLVSTAVTTKLVVTAMTNGILLRIFPPGQLPEVVSPIDGIPKKSFVNERSVSMRNLWILSKTMENQVYQSKSSLIFSS